MTLDFDEHISAEINLLYADPCLNTSIRQE